MLQLTITVSVPDESYEPFRRWAEQSDRTVEEAVVEAMEVTLAAGRDQAEQRRRLLSAFDGLDTASLWDFVRRGAETERVRLLAALNEKRQRFGLKHPARPRSPSATRTRWYR